MFGLRLVIPKTEGRPLCTQANAILIMRFSSLAGRNWYYSWPCVCAGTITANPFRRLFSGPQVVCPLEYTDQDSPNSHGGTFCSSAEFFLCTDLSCTIFCPANSNNLFLDSQHCLLNPGSSLGSAWVHLPALQPGHILKALRWG